MQVASKAHLWTKCALSGSLVAGRADGYVSPHDPDADKENSDPRREGKAAHWLIGEMLAGRLPIDAAGTVVGTSAPNGWIIDAEMVEHAVEYVRYVRACVGRGQLLIEHGIRIGDQIIGRCDCAIIDHARMQVDIFEFKYGWRIVEAIENPELLCYGCALTPADYNLVLHIYQPRPFHPDGIARSWTIRAQEIHRYYEQLWDAAVHAGGPDTCGTPGAHCRDCPGRPSCQALAATVYAQYDVVRDARLAKMTPQQLAAELDFLEQAEACLKERKAGIEAEAEGRMSAGEFLPGWELQPRKGNRMWLVTPEEVYLRTGIDPYKQTVVSPAELEKKGANKAVVKTITLQPSIGRKLARTSQAAFKRMFNVTR